MGFSTKKTIHSQGLRGGPTFSRGGGGGGVQMLISIETHVTCDFPGGVRTPYLPLDPRMLNYLHLVSCTAPKKRRFGEGCKIFKKVFFFLFPKPFCLDLITPQFPY